MADRYDELLRAGVKKAQEKEFDAAEDLIERALELRPGDIPAMNCLGFVFWSRGDADEATRYYRASLDIDAADPHALKGLGLCRADQGRVDEGVELIKKAIDARRNWGEAYYDLGVILTKNKRYVEAYPLLDVASKLDAELAKRLVELLPQVKASADAAKRSK
jgi:protein O-GlcNAc transferase